MSKAIDLIPVDKTFRIMDSTKLTTFMECPRSYFYEYVLGWRPEGANLHLEFGKAWHLAMEYLLLHGYEAASVYEAWQLLNEHYRLFYGPEMDTSNAPKEPANAMQCLVEYAKCYKETDREDKVLYTEIAGVALIAKDRLITFRMDSILHTPKGIISREHKTASQLSRQWRDQWSTSIQAGTYNHVLNCLFAEDEVWGVEINGTIFNKTKVQFERVPARRSKKMMNAWLATVNYWCDLQEREMSFLLEDCADSDDTLTAYPMNPTACTKYYGCRYMDFCLAWPNPLKECQQPPMGMKIERWNPAEEEHKHYFTV